MNTSNVQAALSDTQTAKLHIPADGRASYYGTSSSNYQ